MKFTPTTLIVIVNYRSGQLTINCLNSLHGEVQSNPGTTVVVVDNASGDGSAEVIAEHIQASGWGGWAQLVRSGLNGGFSYGNNVAIRPSFCTAHPADFYWLVNPDTLVRPGALVALLEFMAQHPQAGIAGSSLEDADGVLWPWAFRFPTFLSEFDSGLRLGIVSQLLSKHRLVRPMGAQPERVDWLPGASMMIRREVFASVGLMDESYFLYFEETDFCLQARRALWDCWYVPKSRIMHIAGQSTGVTHKTDRPNRLPAYWFESRRRYFVKNHGRLYAVLTDVFWMMAFSTWRVRRVLQRKPDTDPPQQLSDFLKHSALWQARIEVGVHACGARRS